MANLYLKLIEDARRLPVVLRAMGYSSSTQTDTDDGREFEGWQLCQFAYGMNRDGQEWWSNDFRLFVDSSGNLWQVHIAEQFDPFEGRSSGVHLEPVDAAKMRMWHSNDFDFTKIRESIESLV